MALGDVTINNRKIDTSNAPQFNGTNANINLGALIDFSDEFTIALWIRPPTTPNAWSNPIASQDKLGVMFGAAGANCQPYVVSSGVTIFTSSLTDIGTNVWSHNIIEFAKYNNGFILRHFVNGSFVTESPEVASIDTPGNDWYVGDLANGWSPYLGKLSEVIFYNRILTQEEKTQLANGILILKGAIGYWDMKDSSYFGRDKLGLNAAGIEHNLVAASGRLSIMEVIEDNRTAATDTWGFVPISEGMQLTNINIEEA